MKKFIIISQCSLFIFLASYNAGAQNNSTTASTPEAKPIKAGEELKAATKNSAVADSKELAKPVVVLPLQKAGTPAKVEPKEPVMIIPAEQKAIELRPNPYKEVEPKNLDRSKTSTITGLKNGDPIQLPVQPMKQTQPVMPKE